jgi:filamentous hemagglutinin
MDARYLYRGTTEGWPGNPVLEEQQITCTTTDPLVATLFAVECRNHGRAIILAARRDRFENLIGPRNVFEDIESAINLSCSPIEFAEQAEFVLEVDRAIDILRDLGFEDVPVRLKGTTILQQEIGETHSLGMRLNKEQLDQFNARLSEVSYD